MSMRQTAEGIQRGHLMLGPLEPEGDDHLMTVIRVTGKHSVTCLVNTGKVVAEINLNTTGVHGLEPEYKKVLYSKSLPSERRARTHGGFLIDRFARSLED